MSTHNGFVKSEEDAQNQREAMELFSAGLTYQKVADSLGVSKSTAWERVQAALRAIPAEAVNQYRKVEMERLDALLEVTLKKALSEDKGFLFAVDRALAIMDRRAKLLGLDAPIRTQTEVTTYDGNSIEARVAELRSALGHIGGVEISLDGRTSEAGASTD